jgi:cytochrome c oxidase subunit IV
MSEQTTSVEESHTSGGEHHPSDATYIKVALFLAFITAIEVLLYYFELGEFNNAALIILSTIKFIMVALFFMHLRFDSRILRRFFVTGIVLAFLVYIAYMLTLGVFIS